MQHHARLATAPSSKLQTDISQCSNGRWVTLCGILQQGKVWAGQVVFRLLCVVHYDEIKRGAMRTLPASLRLRYACSFWAGAVSDADSYPTDAHACPPFPRSPLWARLPCPHGIAGSNPKRREVRPYAKVEMMKGEWLAPLLTIGGKQEQHRTRT